MRRSLILLMLLAVTSSLILTWIPTTQAQEPTPTPTDTAVAPTDTPTTEPTSADISPTATATSTSTPEVDETPPPTPTSTPELPSTSLPTPTASATPTGGAAEATFTPTSTPTLTPSPSPTPDTTLLLQPSAEPIAPMIPGTVTVTASVEDAAHQALLDEYGNLIPEVSYFSISSVEEFDDTWLFVSAVGLSQLDDEVGWRLEDAEWVGLVLLRYGDDNVWQGAVEGTEEFSALLGQIPNDLLSADAKQSIDPLLRDTIAAESYRFPWPEGTSMVYGSLGVHDNGFATIVGDWKAVDFLSDGDTSAGHAPNQLLAAASGSISYVCNDGTSVAIRIGDLFYTHLLANGNLAFGRYFEQGEELGQMRPGSFSANCGYANQGDEWFHVHWGFPNASTFAVEDWVLSLFDGYWRRGSEVYGIYTWFEAGPDIPTGVEQLDNRSMEVIVPSPWRGANLAATDGSNCSTAYTGSCSLTVTASPSGQTKLLNYGLPGFSGSAGDQFNLSYYYRRVNAGGAGALQVRVTIRYTDDTVENFSYVPGIGTAGWRRLEHTFTAAKDYDWGVVRVIYSKPNGTLWFDDVSLTRSGDELLDNRSMEIAVPTPWRGFNLSTADGSDCSIRYTGSCSLTVTGSPTGQIKLLNYGLPGFSGSAGDDFALSYYYWRPEAGGAGALQVRVTLRYTDNTVENFSYVPGVSTAGWQRLQHTFTATKDYDWGVIRIIYSKPEGTLWFDDISLLRDE